MSYIDAFYKRDEDKVCVVERIKGERKFIEYDARYVFYYPDARGNTEAYTENNYRKYSVPLLKNSLKSRRLEAIKLFMSRILILCFVV